MGCEDDDPSRRHRRGTKAKVAKVLGAALPRPLRRHHRCGGNSDPCSREVRSGPGSGEVLVPFPEEDDAWVERLRDLARSMQGGSVFIVGRHRLRPVPDQHQVPAGIPAAEVKESAALRCLLWALCDELLSQGYSLSPDCQPECLPGLARTLSGLGCLTGDAEAEQVKRREQVDIRALWELARQVIAHISVSPGLLVAEEAGLSHVLWQPLFLVCVGCGQVRVVTVAFVGGPVVGSRPDCKHTPFVLRLTTDDLIPAASRAIQSAKTPPTGASVRFVVEPAAEGAQLMLEHVACLEEELFAAVDKGDWGLLGASDERRAPPSPRMPVCQANLIVSRVV